MPPTELPPPPPPPSSTRVVGQEIAPATAVPTTAAPPIAAGQTNTLAVVSLVSAIGAPFGHLIGVGGITLIIVSIVTGHMARSQIKKTGERGDGLALAGLIISYVHLALTVLVVIFFFSLIVAFIVGIFGASTAH
jgi:hypothetical protein